MLLHHARPTSIAVAVASTVAMVAATLVLAAAPTAVAQAVSLEGSVAVGGVPLGDAEVRLWRTDPTGGAPELLGNTVSDADGRFAVAVDAPGEGRSVDYVVARAGSLVLVTVIGEQPLASVVVNERTTVAAAYGMARFASGTQLAGPLPGLPNAVGMTHNLADPATGAVGEVLATSPNGDETETLSSFNTLANVVWSCAQDEAACDALNVATTLAGEPAPAGTFDALVALAHAPWNGVDAVFDLGSAPGGPNQPVRTEAPAAFTLALRFIGDGESVAGPGNFAVDHEGTVWVANNYQFDPDPLASVCAGEQVLAFDPAGQYVPGSPFGGGGLSGVGFGITIDPYGDLWLGNYGFASPGCEDQPLHNSVSRFRLDGTPLSPDEGYVVGGISWPQATVSDDEGNIWLANCGNDSVTLIPDGDPSRARQITELGLQKPFAIAHTSDGTAFVTGVQGSTVAMIGPDGTPLADSPISGEFLNRPMGIVADSTDHLWVANSGVIDLPCPGVVPPTSPGGSLGLLGPDGTPVSPTGLTGGGLTIPWGISVDGDDNVWVSNFGGKRISQFCGVPEQGCRPGTGAGDAISPDDTGYSFDGLERATAVIVDQAGNVWATNNWKEIPIQSNPGGNQVVVFVGLAEPVEVPEPRERPAAPPTPDAPPPTPVAPTPVSPPPAQPVPLAPRFTG